MKFETYRRSSNEFFFRLVNEEGEVLLFSEGYPREDLLRNGMEAVKKNGRQLKNYELKTAANGMHFFSLKTANGELIGTSPMWRSREACSKNMMNLPFELSSMQN